MSMQAHLLLMLKSCINIYIFDEFASKGMYRKWCKVSQIILDYSDQVLN